MNKNSGTQVVGRLPGCPGRDHFRDKVHGAVGLLRAGTVSQRGADAGEALGHRRRTHADAASILRHLRDPRQHGSQTHGASHPRTQENHRAGGK